MERIFQILNSDNPTSKKLFSRLKNKMKKPTDYIEMSDEDRIKLAKMFFEFDDDNPSIICSDSDTPADIIIANTVPLRNFEISGKRGTNDAYKYRYTIFDFNEAIPIVYNGYNPERDTVTVGDFTIPKNITDNMEYLSRGDSMLIVGVVTVEEHDRGMQTQFSFPIIARYNTMSMTHIIFDMKFQENGKTKTITKSGDSIMDFASEFEHGDMLGSLIVYEGQTAIETLYVIECALLNPVILEVFNQRGSKIPIDTGNKSRSRHDKRATIRYVKKHYLQTNEIDKALKQHGFVRKSMIWYVTGHWREYQNGKKIFIQGYWKGALRHMKDTAFQNLEPRDRELVLPEEKKKET